MYINYIAHTTLYISGGIVLTFSGVGLDVVAQPTFLYTDPDTVTNSTQVQQHF